MPVVGQNTRLQVKLGELPEAAVEQLYTHSSEKKSNLWLHLGLHPIATLTSCDLRSEPMNSLLLKQIGLSLALGMAAAPAIAASSPVAADA